MKHETFKKAMSLDNRIYRINAAIGKIEDDKPATHSFPTRPLNIEIDLSDYDELRQIVIRYLKNKSRQLSQEFETLK